MVIERLGPKLSSQRDEWRSTAARRLNGRGMVMARMDMGLTQIEGMVQGQPSVETFLELGIMYASGREVSLDRVEAHKWLNIAAVRGCRDAVRLRCELSGEMTPVEIAAAQREARLWLSQH
jgi:uncharacterized protein